LSVHVVLQVFTYAVVMIRAKVVNTQTDRQTAFDLLSCWFRQFS